MMGFFTGPRIALGPGAIEQLAAYPAQEIVVFAAPAVARLDPLRRFLDWLSDHLSRPTVVQGSGAAPTGDEVDRLLQALPRRPEMIVAVGGGSLLDAAKGVRARLMRPDLSLAEWTPLTEVPGGAAPVLVAIPTTSGSGSEMSGAAHLLDPEGATREVAHRSLTADWAFLDADFARSLTGAEAVATGVEVIAHALESLTSEWANPFTDAFARDALAIGVPALARVGRQPKDAEARAALYYAAGRAGLAAANASLGLAHAWARALLPELPRLGYGRLLAVSLPSVVEYNFPSRRDVYESVLPLFSSSYEAASETFGGRIASLLRQVGLSPDLRAAAGGELEPLRARRDRVVRRVLASTATVASPRVPSGSDAGRLFDSMMNGIGRRPP